MRRVLFALVLATVSALPAAAQRVNKSTTFAPLGSRCSVRMPGVPVEFPVPEVKGVYGGHKYRLDRENASYCIAYRDLSSDILARHTTATLLDEVRDSLVKENKGRLISEKSISVNGYPGRDILATVNISKGQGYARQQCFVAGNRVYAVVYGARTAKWNSAAADAFFRSFNIERPLSRYDWRGSSGLNHNDFHWKH